MLLKTGGQLRLQVGQFRIHFAQEADRRRDRLAIGLADQSRGGQLRRPELGLDRGRLFLHPTFASRPAQNGGQLGLRERPAPSGRRRGVEHAERHGMRQLGPKRGERRRVVLAQIVAQLVDEPLPAPDQVLVSTGQHLQRRGELRVARHWPVVVPISPYQVGEHFGVAGIRLGA